MSNPHQSDIDAILAKRHDNGGDFWASADHRLYVGSPFSTLSSLSMLHELGLTSSHEAVRGGIDLVWEAWRDDGKIRLAPKAPLYPCYTAEAARVLCRYGHGGDERAKKTASLLDHWEVRKPIGPCHYGIGTLFMQVEYPFLRYNLFFYVYVLSFYERAKTDDRFLAALKALGAKLDESGRLVVERPHRALKGLSFCLKGKASDLATARYEEILNNLRA